MNHAPAPSSPPASAGLVGACFSPDYPTARAKFLLAAARAGARVDVFCNDAAGPDGGMLTADVAVLGPKDAEHALLVVSATHGPEGFVGSAAQIALLDALAAGAQAPPARPDRRHRTPGWRPRLG